MKILGIETSCDDSCASVVENGRKILSNVIQSQDEYHKHFNGIVPEIASRKHLENLLPVIDLSLKKAHVSFNKIDAIAVSNRPGLIGSLLVGLNTAKSISYSFKKPLIAVNHLLAHSYSIALEQKNIPYPHLSLLVSGGHTMILKVISPIKTQILGSTLDDSCGECFDKIAKYLHLGFPGGAIVDEMSQKGDPDYYSLPSSFMSPKDKNKYNFSYSGLKTASINLIKKEKENLNQEDFLSSFQKTAIKPLIQKLLWASREYNIKTVSICGGVARNSFFRKEIQKLNLHFFIPSPILCTDNAAMVAGVAYALWTDKQFYNSPYSILPNPTSFKKQSLIN